MRDRFLKRGAALRRPAVSSIARRIRVISASSAVVIARGNYRCTDGRRTNAYGHAAAHIGSAVGSAIGAAAIDTSHVNATSSVDGSIGEGISRNTRDAKDGSRSK